MISKGKEPASVPVIKIEKAKQRGRPRTIDRAPPKGQLRMDVFVLKKETVDPGNVSSKDKSEEEEKSFFSLSPPTVSNGDVPKKENDRCKPLPVPPASVAELNVNGHLPIQEEEKDSRTFSQTTDVITVLEQALVKTDMSSIKSSIRQALKVLASIKARYDDGRVCCDKCGTSLSRKSIAKHKSKCGVVLSRPRQASLASLGGTRGKDGTVDDDEDESFGADDDSASSGFKSKPVRTYDLLWGMTPSALKYAVEQEGRQVIQRIFEHVEDQVSQAIHPKKLKAVNTRSIELILEAASECSKEGKLELFWDHTIAKVKELEEKIGSERAPPFIVEFLFASIATSATVASRYIKNLLLSNLTAKTISNKVFKMKETIKNMSHVFKANDEHHCCGGLLRPLDDTFDIIDAEKKKATARVMQRDSTNFEDNEIQEHHSFKHMDLSDWSKDVDRIEQAVADDVPDDKLDEAMEDLFTVIVTSGLVVRNSGWRLATYKHIEKTLKDWDASGRAPTIELSFAQHKTSRATGVQVTHNTKAQALWRYTMSIRPRLVGRLGEDPGSLFFTKTGQPVESTKIVKASVERNSKLCIFKEEGTLKELEEFGAAHFCITSFRKLATDQDLCDADIEVMAAVQAHSVATANNYYRDRTLLFNKRKNAERGVEICNEIIQQQAKRKRASRFNWRPIETAIEKITRKKLEDFTHSLPSSANDKQRFENYAEGLKKFLSENNYEDLAETIKTEKLKEYIKNKSKGKKRK